MLSAQLSSLPLPLQLLLSAQFSSLPGVVIVKPDDAIDSNETANSRRPNDLTLNLKQMASSSSPNCCSSGSSWSWHGNHLHHRGNSGPFTPLHQKLACVGYAKAYTSNKKQDED
ncbi:hypothetical protein YC2023_025802 [Brassica napus]